eukprot:1957883-Amphidinium_carterae.1
MPCVISDSGVTVLLIDSQVVLHVLQRGRSSSFGLNQILRSLLPHLLGSRMTICPLWVHTSCNPADDPTRGLEVRMAERRGDDVSKLLERAVSDHPLAAFCMGCVQKARRENTEFKESDEFKAGMSGVYQPGSEFKQCGKSDEFRASMSDVQQTGNEFKQGCKSDEFRIREYDDSLGYPGEGPFELKGTVRRGHDLAMTVQPATLKRYTVRVRALQVWFEEQGCPELLILVQKQDDLVDSLKGYIQYLYEASKPVTWGTDLLAGILYFHSTVIGHIGAVWAMQKQWHRLQPRAVQGAYAFSCTAV